MQHIYYFDGNREKISWVIESKNKTYQEIRIHPKYYFNKLSLEQSKYVALHVGIFWGIGRFIIKNMDELSIKTDLKSINENFVKNKTSNDPFLKARIIHIKHLINQRSLCVQYQIIDIKENLANKLLTL